MSFQTARAAERWPPSPRGSGPTCSAPSSSVVEDRAAEQEAERDLAVLQGIKILGGGHVEVVRAGHGEVDHRRARERRDDEAGVGPEQAPERLAPARGLAEQVEQPLLFRRRVAPPGRLDPDLAAQGDAGIGVGSSSVTALGDAQLENQQRAPRRMRHAARRRST